MRLRNCAGSLGAFFIAASLCAPAAAQSVMAPGAWQMKMKITAHDPKTGESKTANESTSKLCLSKAFLSKDPYLTPGIDKAKMEEKSASCAISDEKRSANAASWKMSCTMVDGSSVEMTISNTASQRKMTSEIQQVIRKVGRTGIVHIVMDSSYLGQCTKEMLTL